MVDLQRYISYNSFLVNAPVVELVYTLVLEASAERIESSSLSLGTKIFRKIAQLVERLPYTQNVIGSNPVLPTII